MGRNVTPPRPLASPRPLFGSCDPSRFLIYTPKIRNRRNTRRINHLRNSNLYKTRAFFSRAVHHSPLGAAEVLIAKRGIRTLANFRPFSTLTFSNRQKTPFCRTTAAASLSTPVSDLQSGASSVLIAKPNIKNTPNLRFFTGLHFSNREKTQFRHDRSDATLPASLHPSEPACRRRAERTSFQCTVSEQCDTLTS